MLKPLFYKSVLFLLLIILLLGSSFFCLTGKPAVWFDEGIYLHIGRTLADEGVFGIQISPGQFDDLSLISLGYPIFVPLALVIKLFGASIFTARLMMVFFITGFVGCFFLLAKKMYGAKLALISAFLLSSFAPLYGNGKTVIGEVPALFFMTLGLLLFQSVENQREGAANLTLAKRYLCAFLAGLGFGLAVSAKVVFFIFAPALLAAIAARVSFWKRHLGELLSGAIGFILPLLIWINTQFGGALSAERILKFYANPYVLSFDTIAGLIKANLLRFFTESTPIHFALLLLAFVVFLVVKLRAKEKIYGSEIIVLVFTALMLAAWLRTPGWYRYFFPAHALLFLFLPAACVRLGEIIGSRWRLSRGHYVPFIVFFLLLAVQLGHFIKEEHLCAQDSTERARVYLAAIPAARSVIFYNAAELAFLYPHKNFSQYLRINEGLQLGQESLAKLAKGEYDVLAAPTVYLRDNFISTDCYISEYEAGNYSFLAKDPARCPGD